LRRVKKNRVLQEPKGQKTRDKRRDRCRKSQRRGGPRKLESESDLHAHRNKPESASGVLEPTSSNLGRTETNMSKLPSSVLPSSDKRGRTRPDSWFRIRERTRRDPWCRPTARRPALGCATEGLLIMGGELFSSGGAIGSRRGSRRRSIRRRKAQVRRNTARKRWASMSRGRNCRARHLLRGRAPELL